MGGMSVLSQLFGVVLHYLELFEYADPSISMISQSLIKE